jgi:hypothetical protein
MKPTIGFSIDDAVPEPGELDGRDDTVGMVEASAGAAEASVDAPMTKPGRLEQSAAINCSRYRIILTAHIYDSCNAM